MLGPCLVVQHFVSFYFWNHLDGEESRLLYFNCLPEILLLLNALCRLFLTVPWVGLQCVIVVFPDHSRLPFQLLSHFRSARSIINLKYVVYVNAYMGQSVNDIRYVKMQIDTLYPYISPASF